MFESFFVNQMYLYRKKIEAFSVKLSEKPIIAYLGHTQLFELKNSVQFCFDGFINPDTDELFFNGVRIIHVQRESYFAFAIQEF